MKLNNKRKKRSENHSMVGTTYLTTSEQRLELRIAAARRGITMGAAIREAVAAWLRRNASGREGPEKAL